MLSFKLFIFSLTCTTQLINVQATMSYDIFDVDSVCNNEYITNVETYVNDDYRTVFSNFTVVKRFPEDIKLSFDMIGASMGEYVVKTGLFTEVKLCDIFEPNYRFIGQHAEQLGYRKDDCPPSLKVYGTERFVPNLDAFPESFRANNYVIIVREASETVFISEFKLYVRVH